MGLRNCGNCKWFDQSWAHPKVKNVTNGVCVYNPPVAWLLGEGSTDTRTSVPIRPGVYTHERCAHHEPVTE